MPASTSPAAPSTDLSRDQLLELYYWMRLTRSLEERLVNLYRQTKVVGGLFRSLGQEAGAVGSAYALAHASDILSPLIRNLGSMLVKGATPLEMLRQYMAKGDSPTRGRELNIHFGDLERGFIGQISHLGDMVPVMAGVTLSFKMRERAARRPRLRRRRRHLDRRVPRRDQLRRRAALPARRDRREQRLRLLDAHAEADRRRAARRQGDRATASPACRADGNDVLATYDVTKRRGGSRASRRGRDALELMTYRRKGHAEHDNQTYVPDGRDRALGAAERSARPLRRSVLHRELRSSGEELDGDRRARARGRSTRPPTKPSSRRRPSATDALTGVYARPAGRAEPLWFRAGVRAAPSRQPRARGRAGGRCEWLRSPISRRFARRSSRRWSATRTSSAWARTSARTAARSR